MDSTKRFSVSIAGRLQHVEYKLPINACALHHECVQPSDCNHAPSVSSSWRTVPNLRTAAWASSFAGPVITQTARNFLPTAMPAQRSITAGSRGSLLGLKLAGAYPFTSCSASCSSFQGALHASRTRLTFGVFTTITRNVHLLQRFIFADPISPSFSFSRVAEGHVRLPSDWNLPILSGTRTNRPTP